MMQDQPAQDGAAGSQTPAGSASPGGAVPVTGGVIAVGALILIAVIGGLFIMRVRKKLLAAEGESESAGLLLDDMREMLKRGEISQEEFNATRKSLGAKLRVTHGAAPEKPKRSSSI